MSTFRKDLERLINRYSMEGGSDTPDFILCDYLCDCLNAFDRATNERTRAQTEIRIGHALPGFGAMDYISDDEIAG